MAVKLNRTAFEFAKELIEAGRFVADERDARSEHQPSAQEENDFIRQHGFGEYAKWHLEIDDEEDVDKKGRYKFPYGDFENVHRCGVLTAESRAGQYKYYDIENVPSNLSVYLASLGCPMHLSASSLRLPPTQCSVSLSSGEFTLLSCSGPL